MPAKKEKWVRLWCSGGRGHRSEYQTYIRTADLDEAALKMDAEEFNDRYFRTGESMSDYGFKVVRKPPAEWLRNQLVVTRSAIESKLAYVRLVEHELGMLPTREGVK